MKQNMKLRFAAVLSCLLMLVYVLAPVSLPAVEVSAATTETVKIMPLGDSITDCDFWRTKLFTKLADNGYNVESVGSQWGNHEGHSGTLVTNTAAGTQLVDWLANANPDIVMMLYGTNDCWCDKSAQEILDAYTVLVGQMRDNNPNMIILVGKVTPLIPDFTNDLVYRVERLNNVMDAWAADLSTEQSPIYVVDHFTGFDAMTDTYDGCHPNESGSEKICNNWYNALSVILDGGIPETPSTSEAPVVSEEPSVAPTSEAPVVSEEPSVAPTSEAPVVSEEPSAAPTSEVPAVSEEPSVAPTSEAPIVSEEPASGELELVADVSAWSTGYTMNMTVKNTSNTAISNWKLLIEKDAFEITNMWCAEYTMEGDYIVITPMSWNQSIAANGSVNFGFQGTGSVAADFAYTLVN